MAIPSAPTLRRPTRDRWDAIVVGSGIGGVVAAALLARAGASVLVLEKNPSPGGILASYEKQGFKIDRGSHLIARGDRVFRRAFDAAGVAAPRFLTHPVPVRSRGIFDISAPPTRGGLFSTVLEAADKLAIPAAERVRLARLLFHLFTLTPPELAALDALSLEKLLFRYTEHPAAYFLFSFLASIFYVLPPWEVAAGEALRGLRQVLLGYRLSYVEGGMDRLIHTFLGGVVRAGGEIVVSSAVTELRRRDALFLVSTADGDEHHAPVVIANVEPGRLLSLGRELPLPAEYAARLRAIRGSGNAHQIKLALPRKRVEEGCLIGGLSRSGLTTADLDLPLMRRTVEAIAGGSAADPLALYAPVPTNYDPSLAPPGHQLLVGSVYGATPTGRGDSVEVWRSNIEDALERTIPGLVSEALFIDFTSVAEVGAWMGRESCAAIANGQRPGNTGKRRLQVVTPVPGLYLAGDGAGGRGIGTELAAWSGMEAARAVLEGVRR